MGFFVGDEDEAHVLEVEDVPVTAIDEKEEEKGRGKGNGKGNGKGKVTSPAEDAALPLPVLPPAEFHLGDALDVCREERQQVEVEFDYMTSQMTQGPTQDPGVCIQSLVKQNQRAIGALAVAEAGKATTATVPVPVSVVDGEKGHSEGEGRDECNERNERNKRNKREETRCPRPQPAKALGGSIFQTGAGASIKIDPKKVAACRRMLEGSAATAAMSEQRASGAGASSTPLAGTSGSIFQTGRGTSIKISEERLAASRRMLGIDSSASLAAASAAPQGAGGSIFQTGTGMTIDIPEDRLDASRRMLGVDDAPPAVDPLREPLQDQRKAATPMMSRFAPQPKQLPGHSDLIRRQRPLSAAVTTPRMMTPQNTLGGGALKVRNNVITPGSSIAGSANRGGFHRTGSSGFPGFSGLKRHRFADDETDRPEEAQFARHELPVTPKMAAKFAFNGMYGPGDVRAHLLSTGAIPDVVTDAWVRNHYKWIVWKLALLELYAELQVQVQCDDRRDSWTDAFRPGSHLNYEAVKDALSRRYTKEYVEGKQSLLKGVLQRDVPFGTACVLKVAAVAINPSGSANRNATHAKHASHANCTLELTDGWYSIYAECDKEILALAQSKKLFVGQKVRIYGANLTSGSPGDPLEVVNETRIILAYNQIHPVSHRTKLGAQREIHPITPLSCINDRGGKVPRTVVSVLRVFPPMVWSKLPSGVSTFQLAAKAGKAEAALEGELERIFSQVKNEIEEEDLKICKSWLDEGKTGGIKHIQRLYASMVVSGDDQFAEGLNTQDKIDLQEFLMEHRAEMDEERKRRVREVLGSEVPAAAGAKSTPCRTLLVGEVSFGSSEFVGKTFKQPMEYLRPDEYPSMSLLTVWDSDVVVREGDVLSVSALESFDRMISSQAHQGPFLGALKHLKTTKTSHIEVMSADCVPTERVVWSAQPVRSEGGNGRTMTTHTLVKARDRGAMVPNMFDVDAVVVLCSPVHLEESCYFRQWVFAIDYVDEENDGQAHPWVLAIKLSGPQDAIKWFEPNAGGFISHFGNVSLMAYDAEQRFVQLQGSMGTELGGAAATVSTTYMKELLGANTCLLQSLRERLSGLVG